MQATEIPSVSSVSATNEPVSERERLNAQRHLIGQQLGLDLESPSRRSRRRRLMRALAVPSDPLDRESSITIQPARYVLLPLANLLTGYSVKAMERKIERGDWPQGKVWRRAPDGRILIDIAGYQKWVESP